MVYVGALSIIFTALTVVNGKGSCPKECQCSGNLVTCNNCSLEFVPQGIPKTTTHLSLNHNILTEKNLKQIHKFKKLAYLDLRYNEIECLYEMEKLPHLEFVRLDNNLLKTIKADTFSKISTRLTWISVSNNMIKGNIDALTFTNLNRLIHLDLSNNEILAVADNHVFPAQLKHLNISYNPIEKIYIRTFQRMSKLVTIDMYGLELPSMLSSYFADCSSLRELKIGGKALTVIGSSTFLGTKSLVKLVLTDTSVELFPTQIFRDSTNLKYLDISGNPLKDIEEDAFMGLQLKHLFLNGNENGLDLDFFLTNNLSALEHLYLSGNELTIFPFFLGSLLPSLQIFDLSANKLMDFGEGIFPSLIALNLSRNEIRSIPEDFFFNFPYLESVDLSYNRLREVLPDWWLTHLHLVEIFAFENEWSCRCKFRNATNDFTNISFPCSIDTPYDRYKKANISRRELCIVCSSPPKNADQYLVDFMKSSTTQTCQVIRTDKKGFRITTLLCVAVISVVLIITTAVILKKRRETVRPRSKTERKKSTPASLTCGANTTDGGIGVVDRDHSYHPYYTIGDANRCNNEAVAINHHITGRNENIVPVATAATPLDFVADIVYSECRAATPGTRNREHSYVEAKQPLPDLLKKQAAIPGSNFYCFINSTDYQNLRQPPMPPNDTQITDAVIKSDMETQYEPMRGMKRPSYVDFCHPETLLKLGDMSKDSRDSERHTYELE